MTNRLSTEKEHPLGDYLKVRRARLDPAALGLTVARRRTPGLRREEVAQRAGISATWYTRLEQGRGGAPSADVLNRLAGALMLTDSEREHLFLLGLGRLPEVRYKAVDSVTPRLQRVLDALEVSPALIKTPVWDVVAWNRAAASVLTDYSLLPVEQRNILRLIFGRQRARPDDPDWEAMARFVVASFRSDAARAGALAEVAQFVEELCRESSDFERLWRENDVATTGGGAKRLHHPGIGEVALEFSSFTVEGRADLSMIVYNPATPADAERIRQLLAS
jgi:transcriptional regulator with XRE-family HTH domain